MRSRFLSFHSFNWLSLILLSLNLLLGISLIVTALVALPASAKLKNPSSQTPSMQTPATQTIVVFGDSLAAGYGIEQNQGWVNLLQTRLKQQKLAYQVVNASISGETTSGGLARFSEMLATHKPSIVILELGANDGLRGLPVSEMRSNLNQMILQAKAAKSKLLLIGMKIPPNYGQKYSRDFSASYTNLATQHQIKIVPFLLDGVAGKPSLIQDDGLHPLATAQTKLLDNVWPTLKKLLNE